MLRALIDKPTDFLRLNCNFQFQLNVFEVNHKSLVLPADGSSSGGESTATDRDNVARISPRPPCKVASRRARPLFGRHWIGSLTVHRFSSESTFASDPMARTPATPQLRFGGRVSLP